MTSNSNVSIPWIERLIILNLGLLPSSSPVGIHSESNGITHDPNELSSSESPGDNSARGHLDENASLEELSEHILYYFDHSLHSRYVGFRGESVRNRNDWRGEIIDVFSEDQGSGTVCESAVRFSGLCRALYSLPKPLRETMSGIDRTDKSISTKEKTKSMRRPKQIVTLSTCTLVFICLEEARNSIFAVVQIPRKKHSSVEKKNSTSSRRSSNRHQPSFLKREPVSLLGGHPDAVEKIVHMCHSLFQLTKGGDIHSRLLQVEEDDIVPFIFDQKKRDKKITGEATVLNRDSVKQNLSRSVNMKHSKFTRRNSGSFLVTNTVATSAHVKHTLDSFDNPINKEYQSPRDSQNKNKSYPGMDMVYYYRKKIRKLSEEIKKEQQSRETDPYAKVIDNQTIIERKRMRMSLISSSSFYKELAEYQSLLGNLLDVLPITLLRADLKEHYNRVISKLLKQRKLYDGIGVGRCIVEMLPKPFPRFSQDEASSSASQYLPSAPSPYKMLVINKMIRSILHLNSTPDNDYSRKTKENDISKSIFAISTFFDGRHISTRKSLKSPCVSIQTEIACLLFEYFIGNENGPHSNNNLLGRIGTTFDNHYGNEDSMYHQNFRQNDTKGKETIISDSSSTLDSTHPESIHETKGKFVSHPPAALLNTEELGNIIHVPILGTVWIPKIYLNGSKKNGTFFKARTFKYDYSKFSFIFYMNDFADNKEQEDTIFEETNNEDQKKLRVDFVELGKYSSFKSIRKEGGTKLCEMLGDIGVYISSLLSDLQNYQLGNLCDNFSLTVHGENCLNFLKRGQRDKAGVDVIYIDRNEHNIILLSERKSTFTYESRTSEKRNLLSLNFLEKTNLEDEEDENKSKELSYDSNFDGRHLLASYLPFDVMLSFDDIFSEIQRLRFDRSLNIETNTNEGIVELCTFLPLGWMYGRAHNSRELYILFDTNIHVTLADVQKAANLIRSELFNDALL